MISPWMDVGRFKKTIKEKHKEEEDKSSTDKESKSSEAGLLQEGVDVESPVKKDSDSSPIRQLLHLRCDSGRSHNVDSSIASSDFFYRF